MNKLKKILTSAMGGVGVFIFYVIAIFICFLPLQVIDAPNWLNIIITFSSVAFSQITLPIIWTVGLFILIPSVSAQAIVYYVLFVLMWGLTIISIIVYIFDSIFTLISSWISKNEAYNESVYSNDYQKNIAPSNDLTVIKEDDFQIKCPNCGNVIWYKSTAVCEHCNFKVQEYLQNSK